MLRLAFILFLSGSLGSDPPKVKLGNQGTLIGKEIKTVGNLGKDPKTYYTFRNIPYAIQITQTNRFSQPILYNETLPGYPNDYDATRTGPVCPQMSLDPEGIGHLVATPTEDLMDDILGNGTAKTIFPILETLLNTTLTGKTVGEVLQDLLDVDLSVSEDCLHLAVSTPRIPAENTNDTELLPVMFFIHGGAFYAGTQIKMGPERLGDVADIVLVAINYRVGPLGFLCLDTDAASGNMGMLDMVVALEWVQEHIHLFGGDPSKVTIFGESAGSASIGHLLLSPQTPGLFHRAIGQSGSAVSPWAFDFEPEFHARRIARKLDCDLPDQTDLVECMRSKTFTEITKAHSLYVKEERANGTLGFGGTIPCSQTKGERVFYYEGQHPEALLMNGDYEKIPIFFGTNSYEGSFVFGSVYNDFIMKNWEMVNDEDFLRYEFVDFLLSVVGINQGYAFSDLITEKYFLPSQMGNLKKMVPGAMDLLGVFFIKASGYKMVEENSKYNNSFWYSVEHKTRKSAYHLLFMSNKPDLIEEPGVCHADELMYLFNMDLPFILCDVGEIFGAVLENVLIECGLNLTCMAQPDGPMRPDGRFMRENGECVLGYLTEQEQVWSDRIVRAWTNFAIHGTPTPEGSDDVLPYLEPWTRSNPTYLRFGENVTIEKDFKKTYNTALDDSMPPTTTTKSTTTTTTTTTTTATPMLTTTTDGATPNQYSTLGFKILTLVSISLTSFVTLKSTNF